ncbi:protein timeless isoform X1 [Drosophila albomicans]|uniref:Protein timeless isoform X1 n=1 Tax=Drosophila albomicans TaxID=7291 RepID=A0A6P8W1J3_DROAB|nr:protein timeless isoform X1 [Drosophila albomicans]XP_034097494.1 protein timeless isoform X1 [Drosophila albomicans]
MDWLLATPQLHSAFSSLGSLEGDTYVVSPNALAILEEINYKLTYEDQTLRTFRRAIGFGQNVRSDLIPLLENAKDDAVLESVIRILVNLTVPVECLFSVDVMYRTEVGRHTIFELNKLLYSSKEAFTDPKSTKSVVEYMKHILESEPKLSPHKCDQINNCLLLLRNILHIPETHAHFLMPMLQSSGGSHQVSMQNTILWNLFIQSIDKLMLYLMTCPQRALWGVTMVQLIALIYKDQHVSTLQKLLNLWFEASLSESSEDNESNTSPPKQGSGDSSPMLTSDPTSDSSDNGSNGGGSSGKKEGCDERRQALREGTEATLQEVSRKGHEYQNAMARVTADKPDSSEAASDITELLGSPQQPEQCEEEAMDDIDYESQVQEYEQEREREREQEQEREREQEANEEGVNGQPLNLTQSADNVNNTTNQDPATSTVGNDKNNDESQISSRTTNLSYEPFKPPAPLPTRRNTLADMLTDNYQSHSHVSAVKLGQKSPHAGQLQLTKGKCCPQKRECPSSQSELSDCGYGTQVENQESISTSSNDDDGPQGKPQHQKPPCNTKPRNKQRTLMSPQDKKELRRKKLVKRSKSSLINMKGLVQHTPTDDDISNLLKEFTVDFLLKGYNYLVDELHQQLLSNAKVPIDTSHFFWLVTYFLKFAAQLELDMEHIDTILTYDVLSYLTYEGVSLCEQLEMNARQEGSDLKPYLRRMHLVVTAIREFLQAIETYNKVTHLSEDDRQHLRQLQLQIGSTSDLRCLFVLLLRRFNPSIHSKQYLQDLVVTNHILMLILDSAAKLEGGQTIGLSEHISQFATLEVMHYYGILLEDFNNNGEFVNDCIFTMMHHIGGDLGQIGVLFQPIILKTYSRIWEADYELCDDWSDLIEYVIHKFMNTPPKSPLTIPTTSLTEMTKEHNQEHTICTWSQEEMDTLYWYYVQSKKNNDIVGKIVKLFSNNGNKLKTRISIIQQLLQQDIITLLEYDDLMKFEDAEYQRTLLTTPTSATTESGIELKECAYGKPSDDVQILLDLIIKEHKSQHLVWLQKLLLECCYVKLMLKCGSTLPEVDPIMEPVAYHYIYKQKSIPVVQWNNEQSTTMLYQPFVLLLHKLGIQLPADAGSIFARIPDYWTPETMYGLAKKLGPLNKLTLKFDPSEMEDATSSSASSRYHHSGTRNSLSSVSSLDADIVESEELALIPEVDAAVEKAAAAACNEIFAVPKAKHSNSIIRYTPDPTPPVPNWLQLVMRSKCNQRTGPATDISDCVSSTTMTADDEGLGKSNASTSQAPQTSLSATNPTSTLACLTKMSNCSFMAPHNENSSSSGCGGTVSSLSMAALMSTIATDSNADAVMKPSFERLEVTGGHFARPNNLDQEYSAMVASVYENEIANSDNVSVASDLTRMYVSDEDEKHEFREPVPHYH